MASHHHRAAVVANRKEASGRYDEIMDGTVQVEGGWRIYSSGPGIFVNLIVRHVCGIRRFYDRVVIDPVLPKSMDGLTLKTSWDDQSLTVRFSVKNNEHSPIKVTLNERELFNVGGDNNPYRSGGFIVSADAFSRELGSEENFLEVVL